MVCTERLRAQLEELEPRILYSADVASVLGLAAGAGATQGLQDQQLLATASSAVSQASTHEIAFVDLAAPDAQALVAGLTAQRENGRSIEVVTIAADEDGLAVISQTLDSQRDITAVHLFSHGTAGSIQLGSAVLDSRSALLRAGELAGWSTALTTDADLLIYGCDVASNNAGLALIQDLASLTGADVAASDDATGAAGLGGDWLLEQQVGVINEASLLPQQFVAAFGGLLGNDRPVNTTTPNQQDTDALNRGSQQAVAMDAAGNHVVVWTSKNQDGDGSGVYARRFSFDGTALSAELQINTTTVSDQYQPRVAMDEAGNFVVVWVDSGLNGGDVMFRRFDASGNALASEQRANATTTGLQTNPVIGMNRSSGNFVLAWQGEGPGDTAGVFMRRFGASGSAMDTTDIRVNSSDAGNEQNPAVAMDTSNRVVVAFDVANHMYFQRFDANGAQAGGRTQVDNAFSNSVGASIAMDASGNFTLAYREQGSVAPGIWGRGYLANGTQRYTWFYTDNGDADGASIAMDDTGNFVVTYQKTGANGLDIFTRKYNANGSPNGGPFSVNQQTTNNQASASVAMALRNDFVVVWSGNTGSDSYGVVARTFEGVAPVIASLGGAASATVGVAENTSAVTTVTATDADGDTLTYSITGGADAAQFSIVASTGALSFVTPPDFEARADADANNAYELTVTVSDGLRTDSQAISVQVGNVPEAPAAAADHYQLTEEQAFSASVASGWYDAAWSTRQYVGLNNAGGPQLTNTAVLVTLTPATVDYSRLQNGGQDLRFVDNDGTVLDHEVDTWNPAGASYVWVRVPVMDAASTSDGFWAYYGNAAATSNQNSAGVWGTASAVTHLGTPIADVSASANPVAPSALLVADGKIGEARGFDGAGSTLGLGSAAAVDDPFLGGGAVSAWIRPTGWGEGGFGRIASKASTTTATAGWALELDGANQSLLFEYGFSGQVARWRAPVGAITLGAWQHVAVAYDASSAANVPQVYLNGVAVALSTSSAAVGTATSDAAMALTIGNHAVTPDRTFSGEIDEFRLYGTSRSAAQVNAEYLAGDGVLTTLGTAQVAAPGVLNNDVNPELTPMTAGLISGPAHAASFSLNPDGTFTYVPVTNFAGIDSFTYQASNSVGVSGPATVTLTIAGTNDAPVINFGGGGITASTSTPENQLTVDTIGASDPDGPSSVLVWSLVGGADMARFAVDGATGVLSFVSVPDHEAPLDAGADNVYDVVVQVSDGALTDSQALSVTVLPVNDQAPAFTSNGAGASATVLIDENTSAVTTVTATDGDLPTQALSYAIVGGVDASQFSINSVTGVLRFIAARDFESAGDADANNTYEVQVQVTDGTLTDTQALSVQVQPVNEHAPVFNLSGALATGALQVDENVLGLATISALDADLPATGLTYSIVGGADAALFTINPSSGELAFQTGPDFELPSDADFNSVYYVTVQVSDGDFQDQVALRFVVNDVNEAALSALSDSDATANQVLESGAAGSPVGITLLAVDADTFSSTVSYALTDDDGGRFAVDSSTGVVTLARALGEDAQLLRTITVRADSSDGSFSTGSFNITVLPVNNHAPVIQSDGAGAAANVQVDEGEPLVTTVAASDNDLPLQALQFSITGGTDAGLFSIDTSSGVLQMLAPADFESPLDADGDGIYEVTVAVSDGAGLQDSQAISVQVRNRDEAPVWLDNRLSIAEGASAVPLVQALDPDSPPSALRFDIQGLSGGRFELVTSPGLAITGFTQADLAAGRVRFVADGAEAAPAYQLVLGDGTTTLPANAAAVAFTPVNDAPVAGPPVDLGRSDEDQALIIDAASLLAGAQDVEADVLAVTGLSVLSGDASITDLGDGRWQLQPGADWNGTVSLEFDVSDGVAAARGSAQLQVQPVNDAPVLTHPSGVSAVAVSLPENTQAVTVLTAADIDTANSELRFAIVGGADAALFQLDARTGALSLIAAPDFEAPQDADGNGRYEIIVSVSDAQAQVTQALVVSVLGVDEAPVVSRQALLVSAQGLTLVLQAQDPEGSTAALVYEVLATQGGQFELVTANGRQSALSFTQADVDGGRVQFVRDGSGAEPSFKLALSDGKNRVELSRPELIRTVDPVQPEVLAPTRAAEIGLPLIVNPQPEPAALPAVAGSTAPPVQSAAARPQAGAEPAAVPAAPLVPADVPRLAGPQARGGANEAGVPATRVDAGSAGAGFWMQSIAALQLVSDEPVVLRETTVLDGFSSRSGYSLAQAMDAARLDEHRSQEGQLQIDSAGAVLISGGLSVGYVLWLARGGALVASLMSSVPAWASVDPLPVLAQARRAAGDDEETEGEEIDPVDQLFSRARRLLRNAPPASPPPSPQSSQQSSPQTTSRARADQDLREETEWAS